MLRRLVVALLGLVAATAHAEECLIERFPDIAVTFIRNRPAVPVGINGHYVFFMLDTGFTKTAITPATQARFQLPIDGRFQVKGFGTGGVSISPYATVGQFEFSGQTYINPTFPVIGVDAPIGTKGDQADLYAGVIGGDFLLKYDVELDFPDKVMRLYRRPACYGPRPRCSNDRAT